MGFRIPLLVWPTTNAPKYFKGYVFSEVNMIAFAGTTIALWWWDRRDQ
jgi:hypothetical protein